jgi:hypothetical protein
MVAEMSGGTHSFMKQICMALKSLDFSEGAANEFGSLLSLIDSLLESSPQEMQQVWLGKLHSFDNRTLFQAISELISIAHMVHTGWSVDSWNEECIRLNHPQSGELDLLVLSLILDRNLAEEKKLEKCLVEKLNALDSTHRIALTLRQPLSRHIDMDHVASVAQKWLKKHSKKPSKRHSGYVKDNICHIDFRIVGTKDTPSQPTVSLVTPPVIGRQMTRHIQTMMSQTIESVRQQRPPSSNVPVLVSVVSNQSMQLSEHAWKQMLYGLSSFDCADRTDLDVRHFEGWMQDPFRTFVCGVMHAEHTPNVPEGVPCFKMTSYANPWCEFTGIQTGLPRPGYRFTKVEKSGNLTFSKPSWSIHRIQ